MININQLKTISRMTKTQEGRDFVEEVLKPLALDNYKDILREGKSIRDELVGYGNCLEYIVRLCEDCDSKLTDLETKPPADWI